MIDTTLPVRPACYANPTQSTRRASKPQVAGNWWLSISPLVDRFVALVLLIPALPIIGALVLLVRVTSPGAGLFRQRRVGQNGRVFTMYKIRSMRSDAEKGTGAVWSKPGDARVTRLGKLLRASHLDELPQLFNVLRGEMALVGPRPERPEITPKLEAKIPGYGRRHAVRPGITGLAQINLPADTDLDSVRRKIQLDMTYIREASLWLDLRIILSTALKVVGIPGFKSSKWLGIRREVVLAEEMPDADRRETPTTAWSAGPERVLLALRPSAPILPADAFHRAG